MNGKVYFNILLPGSDSIYGDCPGPYAPFLGAKM